MKEWRRLTGHGFICWTLADGYLGIDVWRLRQPVEEFKI